MGSSGQPEHLAKRAPPLEGWPHLSLLLSAFTSRPMASLLSVASSSSRCSFLRLALMRWDSSSASSSCLLSCLTFAFPFSACQGEARGSGAPWRSGGARGRHPGRGLRIGWLCGGGRGPSGSVPAPCTAQPPCARPPLAAGPPSASCPSASGTWQLPASLCAQGGRRMDLQSVGKPDQHPAHLDTFPELPIRAYPTHPSDRRRGFVHKKQ